MSSTVIHVLDKADYSKHRLVTIPNKPPTQLAPSSLRIRPRILGLTTNNLTYARLGDLMGWYDVYPLPQETPEPYNDSEKFGRIAAWGYAEIIESTVPDISAGQSIYGYLPISNGVEEIQVETAKHKGQAIKDQITVQDAHRQHLWKIYNRYQIRTAVEELEKAETASSLGWDALMQGLFGTAYNLSTYGFAWEQERRIHPSGEGQWTASDANLHDAAVVVLNASAKTAIAFAHVLRHHRPRHHQPKTIIGVASPVSLPTISRTTLYDKSLLNSDAHALVAELDASPPPFRRVVLLDFGARKGTAHAWSSALSASSLPFTLILVGGEVHAQAHDALVAMERLAGVASCHQVNASLLREKGIEMGGPLYFDEFFTAFDRFKGETKGVELRWGEGLEGWERGWEAFCRDEVRADTGLVYRV